MSLRIHTMSSQIHSILSRPLPWYTSPADNNMVWYGMVWYGMVWYGMVWYGMEHKIKHDGT